MQTSPDILPFSSIVAPFSGILLDAYGVLMGGLDVGMFPETSSTMEHLVRRGKIVGILSNTTQSVLEAQGTYLKRGLIEGKHYHFIVTSGEVAKRMFVNTTLPFTTAHKKFFSFATPHPFYAPHQRIFQETSFVETSSLSEADFIYISIPHINGVDQTDPNVFKDEVAKLQKSGLPMVCANPDLFAHEGKPARLVVRQGSIAALYEEMGGNVFYIGKPYPTVYLSALKYFESYRITMPSQILMVGDTPETDIRGAKACGISTALTTKTGIMAERIHEKGIHSATQNLSLSDIPEFFIERFAMPASSTL